jgi:hypothetical protein
VAVPDRAVELADAHGGQQVQWEIAVVDAHPALLTGLDRLPDDDAAAGLAAHELQ